MFIRPDGTNERNYKSEWYNFLAKGKDSSFYINPMPKFASDIVLTNKRLKSLINTSLKHMEDEFEFSSKIAYS